MASLQETSLASARGVYVERPRANIFTMLLVIALLAITVACACLWAEMNDYNWDVKATGARVQPEPPLDMEQLLQQSGAAVPGAVQPPAGVGLPDAETPAENDALPQGDETASPDAVMPEGAGPDGAGSEAPGAEDGAAGAEAP